jgi:hypothetical protein
MPLRRRDRKTPNPPKEREMLEERGRQVPKLAMEREIHNICIELVDMEIK